MTAPSKDQAATCTECGFAEPYAWAAISREDGVCFRLEDCLRRQRDAAQEELTRLTSLLEEARQHIGHRDFCPHWRDLQSEEPCDCGFSDLVLRIYRAQKEHS